MVYFPFKDQLIQVDIIDEEQAYANFAKLKETFQKCEQLPLLVDTVRISYFIDYCY